MDFHILSRKELQALCKKNMIPANMTNVAMANALAAMDKVEGLDEFINPQKSDPQHSPERTMQISTEPESSQPLTRTRRTTRRTVAEAAHHVNKDAVLPETPVVPASRRRAVVGQEKGRLAQTPAMQSSRQRAPAASAQRKQEANSARRSVRLLEKSMSKLGLMDKGRVEPIKVDGFSEEVEDVYEKNNVSGAPVAALSPKIEETLCNEDSLIGENSCVNNIMETEEPSMQNVLDTAQPSHSVLGEGSDTSQSLLEDESREYNGNSHYFNSIQSVATAPCAALSPEIKKSLNSDEDSCDGEECGDSGVVIIETEQPSIVNVTDSLIPTVLGEGYTNVAPPEISSDEKSKATDQSKNHTEISEDSNATNDRAVVSLDLAESDSNPTLAEFEYSEMSDKTCTTCESEVDIKEMPTEEFSAEGRNTTPTPLQTSPFKVSSPNATNDLVAADGNIEAPLNSSSIEPQMERLAGVDAIEVKEPNKSSCDSDRTPRTYETCVDVKEMPIEEFSAPVKQQASPCSQQPLAATVSSSPFAEGTLQGQFPRPSPPMAKTTSAKKLTAIISGINKENIDYGTREVLELKKDEADKKDIKEKPSYDDMSLRMLRKKLKEMQIVNKSEGQGEENTTKEGKRRMALQMRPGNCMHAAAEPKPMEEKA